MKDEFTAITIIGVVLSVLIAPVGLLLSIYAFTKVRKLSERENLKLLSLIGIFIGAIMTIFMLIVIMGPLLYFNSINPSAMIPPN